jgi:hypothetical protein
MIETFEYRVDERNAHLLFAPDEGTRLGDSVRKVILPTSDTRLAKMEKLQRKLRSKRDFLYTGWDIHRSYTAAELAAAELLHLIPTGFINAGGEEYGTEYDDSAVCPECYAGRIQVSDLHLDTKLIPKRADVARSIGFEWVFSRRLVDLLEGAGATGVEFRPVRHFRKRGSEVTPLWLQPVVVAPPAHVVPPTRFGIDPVRDDLTGEHVCPHGHVAGLNLLSEVFVERSTWRGEDFVQTEPLGGARIGLFVPHPEILITPRIYRLMKEEKMRGFRVEVAHLV